MDKKKLIEKAELYVDVILTDILTECNCGCNNGKEIINDEDELNEDYEPGDPDIAADDDTLEIEEDYEPGDEDIVAKDEPLDIEEDFDII